MREDVVYGRLYAEHQKELNRLRSKFTFNLICQFCRNNSVKMCGDCHVQLCSKHAHNFNTKDYCLGCYHKHSW